MKSRRLWYSQRQIMGFCTAVELAGSRYGRTIGANVEEGSKETALVGGRTTAGVVRIGNTVRRPPKAKSDFVRHLLAHFAIKGFEGVPRFLGEDEAGREVLSFIEGEVPAELGSYSDRALHSAATLIRRFHDLSADLAAASAEICNEVVCHNDLSPCNFVFQGELPVGIVDFDAAAPGARAYDLGYAAWLWLDIGTRAVPASEQRRRLRVFVDAYGDIPLDIIVRFMMERQSVLITEGRSKRNEGMAEWAECCLNWIRRHASEFA